MSKNLLHNLSRNQYGTFRKYLDSLEGEPRIAWYPSAGEDMRDLLYLSRAYKLQNPASQKEPEPPTFFLHTDYFPWSTSTFLDTPIVHTDERTTITVKSIEELPRLELPLDSRLVDSPRGRRVTGKVAFMELDVQSARLSQPPINT